MLCGCTSLTVGCSDPIPSDWTVFEGEEVSLALPDSFRGGVTTNRDALHEIAFNTPEVCPVMTAYEPMLEALDEAQVEFQLLMLGPRDADGHKPMVIVSRTYLPSSTSFEDYVDEISAIEFSSDGRYLAAASIQTHYTLWELDWAYEFPKPLLWSNGANPILQKHLRKYGKKKWTDDQIQSFVRELADRGFGWLLPEGVAWRLLHVVPGLKLPEKWMKRAKAVEAKRKKT